MDKAVILAAGRGTRMGALTEEMPKPMLPVAGKPILEHIMDRLREAGFRRVLVVTGYREELIRDHFRGYRLEIEYRRQEQVNGTATAALLGRDFAGSDGFLLTHGDILAEAADYECLGALLERGEGFDGGLGVIRVDDPWRGAAVYVKDGYISRIVEKPPRGASTTNWNSAGLYCFRPVVFDFLEAVRPSPRGEYELTTAIEQMIAAEHRLGIHVLSGIWRDVGRPEDIAAAEHLL